MIQETKKWVFDEHVWANLCTLHIHGLIRVTCGPPVCLSVRTWPKFRLDNKRGSMDPPWKLSKNEPLHILYLGKLCYQLVPRTVKLRYCSNRVTEWAHCQRQVAFFKLPINVPFGWQLGTSSTSRYVTCAKFSCRKFIWSVWQYMYYCGEPVSSISGYQIFIILCF